MIEKILCKCGCGETPNIGKIFCHGHNSRVCNPATGKYVGQKISIAKKGKIFTKEHRDKLSYAKGGSGSKFKVKEIIIPNHHFCACGCGLLISSDKKYAHGHNSKGQKMSDQHKKKLLNSVKGRPKTEEHKKKLSIARKKLWANPEYGKKYAMSMHLKPNNAEMKLLILLQKIFPNEWKYTGDFSFMINGKYPDFVNCNGQKKIIELFGDYWHKGQNPQDRINAFKPFGYATLVVWEHELKNKNKLIERLRLFCEHKHLG